MWRFLKGVENPAKKQKLSDHEKKERDKAYERDQRQRLFQAKWLSEFKWLEFRQPLANGSEVGEDQTGREKKMFCKYCCAFERHSGSSFVDTGNANIKHDTLVKHENSASHKKAAEAESAKKAKPGSTPAETMIRNLNKMQMNRLTMQFRTCHALARNARPFTDYVWQNTLDSMKGIDIGTSYLNDHAAQIFTHYIAQNERNKIKELLSEAKFLTVISDGSTDAAIIEAELIYGRVAVKGQIHVKLLGYVNVERANAVGILGAIDTAMKGIGLKDMWVQKLVGFGSDGASVMMGKKGGVAALLKERQPCVQAVHCAAHRLELSYKDTFKAEPLHSKVDTLMTGLYLFYKLSPLNRANLKSACEALKKTPHIPSRFRGTRWIPHTQLALNNVIDGYEAITTHLSQVQDNQGSSADARGKSKNFFKLLLSADVVCFLHFLLDITQCLSILSKCFQREDATVADIHDMIQLTISQLVKYKERPGPRLSEVIDKPSFQGQTLTAARTEFNNLRTRVTDKLVENLQIRFADIESGVLATAKILNFCNWPQDENAEESYAEDDVRDTVKTFKPVLMEAGIDPYLVQTEFEMLKGTLYKRPQDFRQMKWFTINSLYGERFPNILALIDLLLTLPAHSADCERGFSHVKLVKNDWRSKLTDDRVTDSLTIILHTPDIHQYDPTEAIHLWNATSKRRPNQPSVMVKQGQEDSDSDVEEVPVVLENEDDSESDSDF